MTFRDMKAAFYTGHDQIEMGRCIPVEPGPGQVQIRVSHCGICGTDLHIFHGALDHRVTPPAILGHEMSGTIEALGRDVEDWSVGDPVTVMPLDPCGNCLACKAGHGHICEKLNFLGIDSPGAFQSYWTVPARTLLRLPPKLPLVRGALVEPLAVAFHSVRLGEIQPGENVVVIGGGPIGMVVALVAKAAGANVLVSEVNPFRLGLADELDLETVNPNSADPVELMNERTRGAGADAVFEASGSSAGAEIMTQLPRARGRIIVVGVFAQRPQVDLSRFVWRELRVCGARAYEYEDFEKAIELAASETMRLDRLVTEITSLDSLEEGLQKMDSGGRCMKILIDCSV